MKTIRYEIPGITDKSLSNKLQMSERNPDGMRLGVNNCYFTKNDIPWIPVMGEFHYSRYPHNFWEEELSKIKACGVTVIASYIFWIHHEEDEDIFNWSGNNNLRLFIELCKKKDLFFWLRIGPWVHGECRNGGFPDWLLSKGISLRSNDHRYLGYVKKFYQQIFQQVKGLFFKDGGPIIGVQLENEYGHAFGEGTDSHIITLKKMAVEIGFNVPFYTVTGWGGAVVPAGEVLPVQGGYAAEPWVQHTDPIDPIEHYLFRPISNDTRIGTDIIKSSKQNLKYNPDDVPYLTAELGGGIQVTNHRRPIINCDDIAALSLCMTGSGSNLTGYYMFHGGTNPVGSHGFLQESRETGYPNDMPKLSYDFQAMIREYGQFNDSAYRTKAIHYFLDDFGNTLAPMIPFFPENSASNPSDTDTLRWNIRTDGSGGVIFINNHARHQMLSIHRDFIIKIKNAEGMIETPPLSIGEHEYGFMPFNLKINNMNLEFASVQPVCRIENHDGIHIFWHQFQTINPFFRLSGDMEIKGKHIIIDKKNDKTNITLKKWGKINPLIIKTATGQLIFYVLDKKEIDCLWKGKVNGKELVVYSDEPVLFTEDGLIIYSSEKQKNITFFTGNKKDLDFNIPEIETVIKSGKENSWQILLPGISKILKSAAEVYLTFEIVCDIAELYIGNKLVADHFYNGESWTVGLKRFVSLLEKEEKLFITLNPLKEDKEIYLVHKPVFINGAACSFAFKSAVVYVAKKLPVTW